MYMYIAESQFWGRHEIALLIIACQHETSTSIADNKYCLQQAYTKDRV